MPWAGIACKHVSIEACLLAKMRQIFSDLIPPAFAGSNIQAWLSSPPGPNSPKKCRGPSPPVRSNPKVSPPPYHRFRYISRVSFETMLYSFEGYSGCRDWNKSWCTPGRGRTVRCVWNLYILSNFKDISKPSNVRNNLTRFDTWLKKRGENLCGKIPLDYRSTNWYVLTVRLF